MKKTLVLYLLLLLLFFPHQLLAQSATPIPSCPVLPTGTGTVTLSTTIASTGLYNVWSRINPSDSLYTSYWLQIDNNCGIVVGGSPSITANTWTWIDYQNGSTSSRVTISLSSGDHIVRLIGKDPGLRIDKLVITDDNLCVPTGFGDNCTQSPTTTPQPSASPSGTTQLSLYLLLHGVGYGGDNQSPGSAGNFAPLNPQRGVTVPVLDGTGTIVTTGTGNVQFDQSSGEFIGTVTLSLLLPPGSYTVKIASPSYLRKTAPGFISVTGSSQGGPISIPTTTLVVGDANNDNSLDILDYNMIADCFSISASPKFCSDLSKKQAADLNDDGNVDGIDINLFVRNVQTRNGE